MIRLVEKCSIEFQQTKWDMQNGNIRYIITYQMDKQRGDKFGEGFATDSDVISGSDH